jgi:CRP-like cAMP-binding protein
MSYTAVDFKARELVFRQGEKGSYMCLIQGGEFEVIQELGTCEKQVAVLARGDFFGEMAILEEEPRTHTVRALTDAKLIKIDRDDFPSLLVKKPEISMRMIRKLGTRLAEAEDMLLRAYAGVASLKNDSAAHPHAKREKARLIFLVDNTDMTLPDKPEITVGRVDPVNHINPDVDLTKIDTQLTTSRRHAKILHRVDGFYILEERATNGTYVNGQRISTDHPLLLRSGDDIWYGNVRMRFLIDA